MFSSAVVLSTLSRSLALTSPFVGDEPGRTPVVSDAPPVVDTWGISGPAFVRGYAVALAITAVVALAVRLAVDVRRDRSVRRPDDLAPAELAFLSNGSLLVAQVTLWSLVRRGALVAHNALVDVTSAVGPRSTDEYDGASAATTLTVGPVPPAADPVEVALVAIVAEQARARPAAVTDALQRTEAVGALAAGLERRGLLRPAAVRRRVALVVGLVFLPVLAVGVVRLGFGIARNRPSGYLVALVLLGAVLLVVEAWTTARPRWSRNLLVRWRREAERGLAPVIESIQGPSPTTDEATTIALVGTGLVWSAGPELAATLAIPVGVVLIGHQLSSSPFASVGGAGWFGGGGGCGGGGGSSCGGGGGGGCGGGGCGG